MKLCITSTGKDIEARVDTTFGRAPYFLIIDTETNAKEIVENTAATQGQGAGIAAAQLVSDKGADGVLTGYVGPNAFNALRASDIKLFVGTSSQDTIQDALAKFNKGEYKEAPAPSDVPPCEPGRGRGRGMGRGMGRGRGRCRKV
jgi:predicted Fe-Mo cluster-binding NifX family protein